MTDRYDALAGEIMRMMEDDRGLVRSKLADLLEKEVGAWKPDISIGMVASASDHSKLSLKAQLMEAHWRECRADAVKQIADHSKCAPLDLSPGSIHWMNAPTDVISAQPDGTLKRRHAIFDSEFDEEVEPEPDSPPDAEVEIKHVTIDPFADLALQDYREYLAGSLYPPEVEAQKKEFMRNFARKQILSAKAFEAQRAALSADRDIGLVTGTDDVLHALRRAVAPYWAQLATGQIADNKYVPHRFVLPVLGVGDVVAEPEWGNAGLLVTATWPDGQTRTYSMDDLRPNDTCGND